MTDNEKKWFCPNCGNIIQGLSNEKKEIKKSCSFCKHTQIFSWTRRSTTVKLFRKQ